jgi:hypothetical protein
MKAGVEHEFRDLEIRQAFEEDKEKLKALDEELKSTHLDLLESLGVNKKR